jgi:hypothetical protein
MNCVSDATRKIERHGSCRRWEVWSDAAMQNGGRRMRAGRLTHSRRLDILPGLPARGGMPP